MRSRLPCSFARCLRSCSPAVAIAFEIEESAEKAGRPVPVRNE